MYIFFNQKQYITGPFFYLCFIGITLWTNFLFAQKPPIKSFVIDGITYPSYVNLSKNFSKTIDQQEGGNCFIFAASALFESARFKKIGKHIDISEDYLMYLDYQQKLGSLISKNEINSIPLENICSSKSGNLIEPLDGGEESNVLDQILAGKICTQSECPERVVKKWLSGTKEYCSQTLKKNGITLIDLQKILTEMMTSTLEKNAWAKWKEHSSYFTHSKNLLACLKTGIKKQTATNPGLKDYLKLLSAGLPFTCGSHVVYENTGVSGKQAFVVTGYRRKQPFNQNNPDGDFEFFVRDSNSKKLISAYPMNCETINWLK
ncbi:MAG: hypothetical protein QE271_09615 [Bacteriovoracaceae bacterium]|nr:hypothetical protein [Bacteriovoracaceae bacterium]